MSAEIDKVRKNVMFCTAGGSQEGFTPVEMHDEKHQKHLRF